MTFSNCKWQLMETIEDPNIKDWATQLQVSPLLIKICMQRGLTALEDIAEFLTTTPQLWHDPFLMHDMEKAIDRIQQAIETEESILIFGDYDADGITSTAILYETLEMLGADVTYYLPNRFEDGYGPNQRVFEEYVRNGVGLIITVDCGIAAHEPIEWAMAQHCDVILSDHHEIPSVIPKAYAVIHPRHPEAEYPFGDLSGAGVAFKIAHALLGELPDELLEIAAIGTIADLVSLTDENRTLVKLGLQQMRQTQRIGLVSLFEALQIKQETVDEKTIGFQIAPRFNALGRLGDASPGVTLLTTFDEDEAHQLVDFMQTENARRQQIVDDITKEALEMAQSQKDKLVIVLAQKNWHEGVLGIVASRVVEQVAKPTVVLSISEDGLSVKGSARSVGAFNLYDALTSCQEVLSKFGGHHMAAGLSLETVLLPAFIEKLEYFASEHAELLQAETILNIEQVLELSAVTVEFIEQLEYLKPFGSDNPEPLFELTNVQLQNKQQMGAEQQHLKVTIQQENEALQCLAFSKGEWANRLNLQDELSVVGTLEINEWQQKRLPQLMLKDIETSSPQIFDWRTNKIRPEQLNLKNAIYLVNRLNLQLLVAERIQPSSIVMTMDEWLAQADTLTQYDSLVLFDCPQSRELVEALKRRVITQKLYIIAFTPKSVMTMGIPTRERFKQVFQYIQTHSNVPYNETTGNVATYLKIPLEQFKIILKVFFELEFVIIADGFLQINPAAKSVDLMESPLMKQLQEQLWLEKVFIYSQFSDLTKWLDESES